jgi:hypothetical protein
MPSAAGAAAAEGLISRARFLRLAAGAVVPIVLATTIAAQYPNIPAALRYAWAGPSSVAEPQWTMLMDVNRRAAMGDRVYLAMYYRYALRPDLTLCSVRSEEVQMASRSQSPEEFWSILHGLGMRYVVVDRLTHRAWLGAGADPGRTPQGLRIGVLHDDPRFSAYELEADDAAPRPRIACRPRTDTNAWAIVGANGG